MDSNTKDNFISSQRDGAEELIHREKDYFKDQGVSTDKNIVGLAISGGGIRSAIFSLGVMQRLARKNWMEKIDYLSTVSGGGYIGSSLTWFLHQASLNKDDNVHFGVTSDDFPFGTHCLGKVNPDTDKKEKGGDLDKAKVLQSLRQNGEYLAPGNGITMLSLLGIFLRGIFLSIVVYFPLLVLFFLVLYAAYIVRPININDDETLIAYLTRIDFPGWGSSIPINFSFVSVIGLICFSIAASVAYAVYTYFSSPGSKKRYMFRRFYEKSAGRIIISIIVLVALGILPLLHDFFESEGALGRIEATLIGSASIVLGFITTIATYLKSGSIKNRKDSVRQRSKKKHTLTLLTGIASFLLIYGILFLSYSFSYEIMVPSVEREGYSLIVFYVVWIIVSLIVGRYVNLNYVSVHRYYRDRLMETFMPNIDEVIKNGRHDIDGATDADSLRLSEIEQAKNNSPYHIINSNIVLVESPNKKYRGRGGDNFILSPLFCGSEATGWMKTDQYMNNEMTLATAMAISGAAANPDTGVGGEGPTRNRALSLLMSLLNIRLGYWAPHPNPEIHPQDKSNKGVSGLKDINPLHGFRPNFFHPMLTSTMFGNFIKKIIDLFHGRKKKGSYLGKTENSHFIELTDGGHFENLGLYELIRRKLKIIIVCDGGADSDFEFSDLANAIEKILIDFGVTIALDISPLIPARKIDRNIGLRCAERGYVIGDIFYPDNSIGKLIYIKTTFTKGVYADLICYKKKNPLFPDQSTSDQFFDEKQFEAYRGLGHFIAKQLTDSYELTDEGLVELESEPSLRHEKQALESTVV